MNTSEYDRGIALIADYTQKVGEEMKKMEYEKSRKRILLLACVIFGVFFFLIISFFRAAFAAQISAIVVTTLMASALLLSAVMYAMKIENAIKKNKMAILHSSKNLVSVLKGLSTHLTEADLPEGFLKIQLNLRIEDARFLLRRVRKEVANDAESEKELYL